MSLYYGDETTTIWHGDCIDIMRTLNDNSVDSIVTDPPYGLGFMGKAWDALPPGEEWARECLRVLKPGGHLLAFGGTRTWHRLAVAVEDAGFEIRDSIAWMYGSGFPKSLDVSKAIDKARTEDLEPIRAICRAVRAAMDVRDLRSRNLVQHFGDCNPRLIDHWAARDTDSQPALPKWDQWEKLCELFSELTAHDAEVWRLNGRKGSPGEAWDQREVIGERRQRGTQNQTAAAFNTCKSETEAITAPATPAAQQWQGWGTALKPAFEPIVMARKPLIGTVAANVQAHGTGALDIEGSRTSAGRWPANVALDEHMAAVLDAQSGVLKSPSPYVQKTQSNGMVYTLGSLNNKAGKLSTHHGDSGGASRFFKVAEPDERGATSPYFPREFDAQFMYVAKAPKKERPVVDNIAHATVKPLALMRWLVRLVTPEGGTVLEPFAGSGTTVEACILEGLHCIAIEQEAEYLPLIQARIDRQEVA